MDDSTKAALFTATWTLVCTVMGSSSVLPVVSLSLGIKRRRAVNWLLMKTNSPGNASSTRRNESIVGISNAWRLSGLKDLCSVLVSTGTIQPASFRRITKHTRRHREEPFEMLPH